MISHPKNRYLLYLIAVLYGCTTFLYGLLIIRYHLPPYQLLKDVRDGSLSVVNSYWSNDLDYDREGELLKDAFSQDLLLKYGQLYPPSHSHSDIARRINDYYFDTALFVDVYQEISVVDASIEDPRFTLSYGIGGRHYAAHAYFVPVKRDVSAPSCAALVIPGSGVNEASKIFQRDPNNYQSNIVPLTEQYCDSYVFVKPNEDFTAIHNGNNKLDYEFIVNYLINKGGSYSAHYLVNSLAITKYLKREYSKVFVVGLSQGGAATLLNALQSEPAGAVVASGFSVINFTMMKASFLTQIVIPGIDREFNLEEIYSIMGQSDTEFMFTYGRRETGVYKVEAEEGYSCQFLAGLSNVTCLTHEGEHEFAIEWIADLLSRNLGVSTTSSERSTH